MRKLFLIVAVLFSVTTFAQEAIEGLSEGLKAKNAGNEAYRSKDYVTAISQWEKYLSSGEEGIAADSNTVSLYNTSFLYAADAFMGSQDFQSAYNYYEKYMSKVPEAVNDGKTNYNIANAAVKTSKTDKALTYFQKSIELGYKPDYSKLYIATIYKKMGNESKMEEVLLEAIEKHPDSKVYDNMIKMLLTPLLKEAAIPFNKANELAKEASVGAPADYIAKMGSACDKFQESIPLFEKVLKLDAKNEQALTYMQACQDNIKTFNDYKATIKK